MKKLVLIYICLVLSLAANAQQRKKVACVGNSITYGYSLPDRNTQSYPAQLQKMLGESYEVGNFGKPGATLLNKGHLLDVHPNCKKPIGERLARWALNKTYSRDIIPSGPLFHSAINRGRTVFLSFDYGQGMKSSDGESLRTFELAEIDGLYYPATAEIIGEQVKIYSKDVPKPRFVRYGWQPFTRANLVNQVSLPASPFKEEIPVK